MPSDDYAAVGGGALKLKGGKVEKKKKKKRDKTDLEKNLASGDDDRTLARTGSPATTDSNKAVEKKSKAEKEGSDNDEEERPVAQKTETELRHEEYRKKKLLEMAKSAGTRPELLKTHKERVEELNTYLSKLSEHHDMPKIGPG